MAEGQPTKELMGAIALTLVKQKLLKKGSFLDAERLKREIGQLSSETKIPKLHLIDFATTLIEEMVECTMASLKEYREKVEADSTECEVARKGWGVEDEHGPEA